MSTDIYSSVRTEGFRIFGSKDQITRAGLPVPPNIAEGYERESSKEMANFLSYAKGSFGGLRTQIHIGMEIGCIDKTIGKVWISKTGELAKMLSAFIKTVQTRTRP